MSETQHLRQEHFQAARASIAGQALLTPLVPVGAVTTPAGNPLLLKAENLQPGGSFKIRGAIHSLACLTLTQRAAGVIAYSTGNHARAVAIAARQMGIRAKIVMSPDVPAHKIAAVHEQGAVVVMAAPSSQARRDLAEELARAEGLSLIPPYDHFDVMAGQGTIGLEILEQTTPAAIFVPVGGGGLLAGIAAAVKQATPAVRVIGVEPEWENDAWQSFRLGHQVALPAASGSIADAIRVQSLGDLTYPVISRYVDEIVTVSEAEIAASTLLIASVAHLVVEPAGGVGLAAALAYRGNLPEGPVVSIASGGNTTLAALHALGAAAVVD
ncbi:MAG TPA: threonine/serine dehydratase [Symbiobacteriaceae bacterium]|jgi:threonine dehydratase